MTTHESYSSFLLRLCLTLGLIGLLAMIVLKQPSALLNLAETEWTSMESTLPDIVADFVRDQKDLITAVILNTDLLQSPPYLSDHFKQAIFNLVDWSLLLSFRILFTCVWFVLLIPAALVLVRLGYLERRIREADTHFTSPFIQRQSLHLPKLLFLSFLGSLCCPTAICSNILIPVAWLVLFAMLGYFIGISRGSFMSL